MSAESELVAHLQSHPGLTTLIADRIYPGRMPDETTLPCVVYNRVTTGTEVGLNGVDVRLPRFQCDAWASRYGDAEAVAVQLRAALDLASTPSIERLLPVGEGDRYDNEALLYGRRLDYQAVLT